MPCKTSACYSCCNRYGIKGIDSIEKTNTSNKWNKWQCAVLEKSAANSKICHSVNIFTNWIKYLEKRTNKFITFSFWYRIGSSRKDFMDPKLILKILFLRALLSFAWYCLELLGDRWPFSKALRWRAYCFIATFNILEDFLETF